MAARLPRFHSRSSDCQIEAVNPRALFSLKLHRGDGMTLLAMNWKQGMPPVNFVGFAIEYKEPESDHYWPIKNRINFANADGSLNPERSSSLRSPIQKFRWVHFPRHAEKKGAFTYRVTPVLMTNSGQLRYAEPQQAEIELARETYPGQLNVSFTRGFVSSQAFVDHFVTESDGMQTLIPANANDGLRFVPSHPRADEALAWMGFEARSALLELLDSALADASAQVMVVGYELNDPALLKRLLPLRERLRIILDDSDDHQGPEAAESQAAARLLATAGAARVKRQHMGNLQHNKLIVVAGATVQAAVCGSTNFSWRGQFVQSNNALVVRGSLAIRPFLEAFENYWLHDSVRGFAATSSTIWNKLDLPGIDAKVTFSPHSQSKGVLDEVAADIRSAESSVFYSLAFLSQTPGPVSEAIQEVTADPKIFVYGVSDKKAGGLMVNLPSGRLAPVYASYLNTNVPEPFKSEPSALGGNGGGTRMHHKFVVLDFDKPSARVYLGSYNFSRSADIKNGENLLLIRDRRIAVSYMIQALTIFDHYHFRVVQASAQASNKPLQLQPAPPTGEAPWWQEHYSNPVKILDRLLFA